MRKDNRERSEYYKEYYQRNRLKKLEYAKNQRKLLGPIVLAENQKNYYLKNHHMMAYKKALRRSRKKLATPVWSDLDKINKVYANCSDDMTVDHIIPITSPIVCGLHVSWNMQYLTRSANSKKGNSLPPPHQYIRGERNEHI
jgi:5-methylcytosine-specific restriction endonuclease McrA|tara:strand:+ start:41 stop:466 length:426 start_codon:yes stop_codon:yes gene_type:complete